jgi:hypothetical protein
VPDLDTHAKREAHARVLASHYGLAPHAIEVRAAYPRGGGVGRTLRVLWHESDERLVSAGLVTRAQVAELLELRADPDAAHAGLAWMDGAGTRWVLTSNGGPRGDEFGLWVTASYPDEAEALPPGAETPAFRHAVERLVRAATGRPVRFTDPDSRSPEPR